MAWLGLAWAGLAVGPSCALVSGQYACEGDDNCPTGMVCAAGTCLAGTPSPDGGVTGADAGPGQDAGPVGPCTGLVTRNGNATVSSPGDITALRPANNQCLRIAQRLQIVDTGLTDLDGLEFLVEIGRDLTITGNPDLTSVAGLSGLTFVERNVTIEDNPGLRQCDVDDLLTHVTVSGQTTVTGTAPCP